MKHTWARGARVASPCACAPRPSPLPVWLRWWTPPAGGRPRTTTARPQCNPNSARSTGLRCARTHNLTAPPPPPHPHWTFYSDFEIVSAKSVCECDSRTIITLCVSHRGHARDTPWSWSYAAVGVARHPGVTGTHLWWGPRASYLAAHITSWTFSLT